MYLVSNIPRKLPCYHCLFLLPTAFQPISWPLPPMFSPSSDTNVWLLHASFWCWSICRHASALHLPVYSSAFWQALFPRDSPRIHLGILLLNILTTSPTHCNLLACMYATRSVSVDSLYSFSLYHIFQMPLTFTGAKIIPRIFLSQEPIICAALSQTVHVSLPYRIAGQCTVNINPVCTSDIFILNIIWLICDDRSRGSFSKLCIFNTRWEI